MGFDLKQAILEIRFSSIIDTQKVFNDFNSISNNLKKIYGNSNYDFNNKALILSNPIGAINCVLAPDRLSIDANGTRTIEDFCKVIEETLKEFRENALLDDIARIGFRTFSGKDYSNLQLANEVIARNFDICNTGAKYFSNSIDDIRVGFSTKSNIYTINYNFAAATNREMQMNNGVIITAKETYCVLVDMDIFVEDNCKYRNIFEYLYHFKDLTDKNIKICNNIF